MDTEIVVHRMKNSWCNSNNVVVGMYKFKKQEVKYIIIVFAVTCKLLIYKADFLPQS